MIRQGSAGTRRVGDGVERLVTDQEDVRTFRFRTRKGTATIVANFANTQASVNVSGTVIDVQAMDTIVIEES